MSVSATDELAAWKAAAVARGYSYQSHIRGPLLRGLLFRTGDSVVATSLVSALQAATPFFAGSVNGRYKIDEQDSRSVSSSFVAIPLARKVPNVVLLGKGVDVLRSAGIALQSRQKLSIDDHFEGPFTLYSHGGHEREALEIFTPEFLHLLAETTEGCDVELIDTWMFVYSRPGRFGSEKALTDVERLTKHVKQNVLPYIEPETPVGAEPAVPAEPAEPAVEDVDAAARLAAREQREARVGAIAAGRDVLDARSREIGRLVGVGIGAFALGAAAWWLLSDVLFLV
jgi:hypothetical protein